MKTYNNLFNKITSFENLCLAWQKARAGKTRRADVTEFEKYLERNLLDLQFELKNQFYKPLPLESFILRDPKTRKILKSDFRDRVVHHAIVNILEPIFDKTFINDSCANRKGKGTLYALKRFDKFKRKVTKNNFRNAFALKADIKHYFQEVDRKVLLEIIKRKISDGKTLSLVEKIVQPNNLSREREREHNLGKGMPLGNLTSQFFANIYLNELDQFIKRKLHTKYYIRYVDDFVILHNSKEQLEIWKVNIDNFLEENLKLKLHTEKSRIVLLKVGVDFVGFRIFPNHKLLRKRNIRNIFGKIKSYENNELTFTQIFNSYRGWRGYAQLANTYKLRAKIRVKIIEILLKKI